jgi:putative PIG3 family NAD(P)H quinone oxidoreductase
MFAIVITKPGDAHVLQLADVADIFPKKGEVRVCVKAAGVNRADILQRMGKYPAPPDCPAQIPGMEFAGIIDTVGDGTSELTVGDRVFGLIGGGSYAQYVVVNAQTLVKIPAELSFVQAAAIPEVFITAYDAMVSQAKLKSGETVLINGIASGVGTAAAQIAKALGAKAIGTSRSISKLTKVKELVSLDYGISSADGKFADEVMRITDQQGVDIILELVGGNYVSEDIRCASTKARIVVVGLLAGAQTNIELGTLLRKRLELRGTTLRARPLEEKILVTRTFEKNVVPLFIIGKLKPIIDKVYPLAEASKAHEFLEQNENIGKVVLEVN